jgi:hypothetical protein
MPESIESLSVRLGQMTQILDEYRVGIFTLDQKLSLLIKMLEEKHLMATGEFDKRWPIYLKSEVGILGSDGVMEGSLKVTFYGQEGVTA